MYCAVSVILCFFCFFCGSPLTIIFFGPALYFSSKVSSIHCTLSNLIRACSWMELATAHNHVCMLAIRLHKHLICCKLTPGIRKREERRPFIDLPWEFWYREIILTSNNCPIFSNADTSERLGVQISSCSPEHYWRNQWHHYFGCGLYFCPPKIILGVL